MIVIDAGPLWAAADSSDRHHERCVDFFRANRSVLYAPAPTLSEVCHGLNRRNGPHAEARFLRDIVAGPIHIVDATTADYQRAATIIEQYADNNIGYVDAMVIATAERLKATKVATVDHRHFRAVRPAHTPAFELLP